MFTRHLGPDRLAVSAVGLGCMGMSQAYGPTDDHQSLRALHAALDLGMSLLDTAQSYGAGHNERLLSTVLAERRDEVVLATKVGITRDADGVHLDAHPDRIAAYCDASLQRLGVDVIDLYYLHRVDPEVAVEDSVGAMAELVAAGKVRHLGVSEVDGPTLRRAVAVHPIAALQTEWSLWWREVEDDVLPTARSLGVGVVAYSPLGRGFLSGVVSVEHLTTGDLRLTDPRFAPDSQARNAAVVAGLARFAGARDVTTAQLALAWLLAQGDGVVPIPGTKRAERVTENAAAAQIELSAADLAELETLAPRAAWAGDRASFAAHGTTRSA